MTQGQGTWDKGHLPCERTLVGGGAFHFLGPWSTPHGFPFPWVSLSVSAAFLPPLRPLLLVPPEGSSAFLAVDNKRLPRMLALL